MDFEITDEERDYLLAKRIAAEAKREKPESVGIDINSIKPGMSAEDRQRAATDIVKALRR